MSRTRQAVILARGLGTRMRHAEGSDVLTSEQAEAASAGLKGMIPFARPFLDYVLSALADSGITSATLVIGPEHDAVRSYFTGTSVGRRVAIDFAEQSEARGTAHAVLSARLAVDDGSFLVLNADNYYFPAQIAALAMVGGNGLVAYESTELAALSGIDKARVLRFALLNIASDDTLRAIVEKPARSDPLALQAQLWVSMNLWSFTPAIFEACERVTPTERGELELASAVMYAMNEMEESFSVIRARAGVFDLSSRSDVERVRRQLAAIDPRP